MDNSTSLADLFKATREFYTRKKNKWARWELHDGNGGFCVLGAMSAVVTNEEKLRETVGRNCPHYSFKNYQLIRDGAKFLSRMVGERSIFAGIMNYNDRQMHTNGRDNIIALLRKAEREAREQGV